MNTPVKIGPEFLVNTTTHESQSLPTITALSDGRFVIVWQDLSQSGGDTSGYAIRAQVFSATGAKQGAEFLVNTTTQDFQSDPTITALSDGRFVIAWSDYSQSGGDTSYWAIRAQVFSATGAKQGGEVLVNTSTLDSQVDPTITALSDGRFVITWEDWSQSGGDASERAIRAQVFSATGARQGPEFLVNTTTEGEQSDPAITALSDGRFVIAWTDWSESGGDPSGSAIRAQVFSAMGAREGAEILVNTTTQGDQYVPTITALSDGRFVIAWTDYSLSGGDTPGYDIRAQMFSAAGEKQGAEVLVNTTTQAWQFDPTITALSDGRFVIAWTDDSRSGEDTSFVAIRAQVFSATGDRVGPEFLVNTTTQGWQLDPTITALSNGRFVIAWEDWSGTGGDTSEYAIRAQIFDAGGDADAPYTAAEIFAEHGKMGFLALMSKAAYHLRPDEPTAARYNNPDARARTAYDTVAGDLALLDDSILDGLGQGSDRLWVNRMGGAGDGAGLFTNRNGAALVGQAQDALFIAFRGTNNTVNLLADGSIGIVGADQDDWFYRPGHFNLFKGLLEEIRAHVQEQGDIRTIYLTGHSLGAAMVQPALHWLKTKLPGVAVEGVTFASPGYLPGYDRSSGSITNFWNAVDVIRLPEAVSTVEGEGFVFNNVVRNLYEGFIPLSAHSMDYYLEIARFFDAEHKALNPPGTFKREGLDIADLRLGDADRVSFGTETLPDGSLKIGGGRDFILAGVLETLIGVATKVVSEVITSWSDIWAMIKAARDFGAAVHDISARTTYEAIKSIGSVVLEFFKDTADSLYGLLKKASLWLFVGETAIEAVEDLNADDLVLGGDGGDVLYGLGGHDTLIGGKGDDHLHAGRGVDLLFGGAGDDALYAGDGPWEDEMHGGVGSDQYWVMRSTDRVVERVQDTGIDTVRTEVSYSLAGGQAAGVENLFAVGGNDVVLTGNALDNLIIGSRGNDQIDGGHGRDRLIGNAGKDILSGGSGNDMLFGGIHKDELRGGGDNDTLDGGVGADVLTGGSGADIFVFATAAEAHGDRITDFTRGADRIDLSRIAADLALGALRFTGTKNDWGTGDVYYRQATGLFSGEQTTQIRINTDGGPLHEAVITLSGHHALTAADFILG